MLSWPPCLPGPSPPANRVTIWGCSGKRLSTGGKAPDFTRSTRFGVSCIAGSGSAAKAGAPPKPSNRTCVRRRRFIANLTVCRFTVYGLAGRLPLGEGPLEQAVAVEHDRRGALLEGADDVHLVAAADDGRRLELHVGAYRRLEVPLRAAFLLEATLHIRADDRDVDGHLVGRALAASGDVQAISRPGENRRLGQGRPGKNHGGECGYSYFFQHRSFLTKGSNRIAGCCHRAPSRDRSHRL